MRGSGREASQQLGTLMEEATHRTEIEDDDPAADSGGCCAENNDHQRLSKRQQSKVRRQQTAMKFKHERRKKEKEKKKIRRQEAREKGLHVEPNARKRLRRNTMKDSSCKVQVAIDCSFDELMNEWDIINLVKQIQHSYAANRRAENPLQFYVTGVVGKTKDRLEAIDGYENWDVHFKEEDYDVIFKKEGIVYLSSESENVLTDLEQDTTYIIGGLVDHNHHKGLCHKLATEKGIRHAQLPISEFLDMKTRKVLTINHVFEILVKFTEIKDWGKAFFNVLPQRKGAVIKNSSSSVNLASDECSNNLPSTIHAVKDLSSVNLATDECSNNLPSTIHTVTDLSSSDTEGETDSGKTNTNPIEVSATQQ